MQPATNSANNEKKVNEVRDEVERAARDQVGTEKRAGRAEPDGVQVHKASTGDCEDPADIGGHRQVARVREGNTVKSDPDPIIYDFWGAWKR